MKENVDRHIEQLVDKTMKYKSLETPSFDFTKQIMSQVEGLQHDKVTVYKPLISKPAWIVIGVGFMTFIAYLVLGTSLQESGWLNQIDFNVLFDNRFTKAVSGIKLSSTLLYSFFVFAVMVGIQIPVLKHYFDKRLTV